MARYSDNQYKYTNSLCLCTRELRKYIGPGLKLYVKKPSKIVRQNETAPRDRPSPMRKGSSFIRVYTMGDCQHASPVFTQHAWVYTLTRCCVDFEIFNTCFVSGFTQYKQVQQHFRVYTIILRLSLRPREQAVRHPHRRRYQCSCSPPRLFII